MDRILIAYFSRSGENYFGGFVKTTEKGNTEICVNLILEFLEADTYKIEMEDPYSDNYQECTAQAKQDLVLKRRPKLTSLPENIGHYDTVILGYPNYWGTLPMAVAAFLEAFDFSEKKILPFCTHEGGDMGRSEAMIKKLCPTAEVAKGKAILGSNAANAMEDLEEWIQETV